MRRMLLVSVLFILMMTACAPAAATEAPTEIATEEPSTSEPGDVPPENQPAGPAEETAIKQLAENLGLQESDITVISSEETEFSNACLDVVIEGMLCAEVITPGRIVVLEANDIEYEYHTSEDGSRVQPATPALIWKREGGIAGFCDTLTVFRSGEVFASKCNSQDEAVMGTFATLLSAQEGRQFNEWITEFDEAELDASDPAGVADRMMVTLKFVGVGDKTPTSAQEQELFDFAQNLYTEMTQ